MISHELYKALWAWRAAASTNPPHLKTRRGGLCGWVSNFALYHVGKELDELLMDEFNDTNFPFNNNNRMDYRSDRVAEQQHLNPRRRAWVEAKLKEYEDAQHDMAR